MHALRTHACKILLKYIHVAVASYRSTPSAAPLGVTSETTMLGSAFDSLGLSVPPTTLKPNELLR